MIVERKKMSDKVNTNEGELDEADSSENNEEALLESEKKTSETDNSLNKILELPQGKALEISNTYEITAAKKTRFIVLAGSVSSGKTTLITSIYHLFQRGMFAEYMFAGSKTLIGFEQRCHPARISSNNPEAQTPRTPVGISDSILHLTLRDNNCQREMQDLLITDFSGEDYGSVIANIDLAKSEFDIIKRSDHFVLLIDGDNISQKHTRQSSKKQSIMLLRTFRDGGLLGNDSRVDVLISKYDIVKSRCDSDFAILSFIEALKDDIDNEFSKAFRQLRIFEIAARPQEETDAISLGYGMKELIPNWMKSNSEQKHKENIEYVTKGHSEFNMFAFRTLGHKYGRENEG